MKILAYIYKTKTLANHGKFSLVSLCFIFMLGIFFIPKFQYPQGGKQITYMSGTFFKYDDYQEMDGFFRSIRDNKGYLCIGTSESVQLEHGNYYQFLNNDNDLQVQFSILSGAGRNGGLHVPLFLKHREAVKNLKVIYLVNPVYWNTDLGVYNTSYWNRYSSYGMLQSIDWKDAANKKYKADVDSFASKINTIDKINQAVEYNIRRLRKRFFSDLNAALFPSTYLQQFSSFSEEKRLDKYGKFGEIATDEIDTVWNIRKDFTHKEWFKRIDLKKQYRTQELTNFIQACKDLGIDCTFIIGPYNQRFIEHQDPAALADYIQVTQNLKQLFENEKVDYIDATDISNRAGAFNDHQHHSSYGAYLLYLKIKNYVHEKESN